MHHVFLCVSCVVLCFLCSAVFIVFRCVFHVHHVFLVFCWYSAVHHVFCSVFCCASRVSCVFLCFVCRAMFLVFAVFLVHDVFLILCFPVFLVFRCVSCVLLCFL